MSVNQDLQANSRLVSLLMESKAHGDRLYDGLSGIYAVINEKGRILRGNLELARLLGVEHERLLGTSILKIIDPSAGEAFLGQVRGGAEFEVPVTVGSVPAPHLWQAFELRLSGSSGMRLYNLIGRDISNYKRMLEELVTVKKDLEVTSAVQNLLLPKEKSLDLPHLKLRCYYQSASQAGGDWWSYDVDPDGRTVVFVGDVMGHGIGAAMVTAAAVGTCQTLRQHTSLESGNYVRQVIRMLDLSLTRLFGGSYPMTLLAIEFASSGREVKVWRAGAVPVLLKSPGARIQPLGVAGCGLGMTSGKEEEDEQAHGAAVPVVPGSRVFAYTDGLLDAARIANPGVKKWLHRMIEETGDMPIDEALERIVKGVRESLGERMQPDDITLVVVEIQ